MRSRDIVRSTLFALALPLSGCEEPFYAGSSSGGGGAGTTTTTTTTTGAGGTGGGQTTSTTTGGGGAASCEPLKVDTCNECLAQSCADPYCACTGSQDCLGFLACVAAGGTMPSFAWYEKCWHDHKASISLGGRLAVCSNQHCPACGTPAVDPCLACEYKQCAMEVNECLSTSDCTGYIACLTACAEGGNPAGCTDDCTNGHAAGVPLWDAVADCGKDACAECQ